MNSPTGRDMRPFAPLNPQPGTGPVPVSSAVDPAFFELERERIFRGMWVSVTLRAADLPNPGDYFVRYLEAQDASMAPRSRRAALPPQRRFPAPAPARCVTGDLT
nr:C834 [uncultured bacterium]